MSLAYQIDTLLFCLAFIKKKNVLGYICPQVTLHAEKNILLASTFATLFRRFSPEKTAFVGGC